MTDTNHTDSVKPKGTYDLAAFRKVVHGNSDCNAYCRHCSQSWHATDTRNVKEKARDHARKTLHTVDVYNENHTQYTSYVKAK